MRMFRSSQADIKPLFCASDEIAYVRAVEPHALPDATAMLPWVATTCASKSISVRLYIEAAQPPVGPAWSGLLRNT
jgi:hypothetical protein